MSSFRFIDDPPDAVATTLVVRIGKHVQQKPELLVELARGLSLPAYFGHNWDALEECLRDLNGVPPSTSTIVLWHESLPLEQDRAEQRIYLQLLQDLLAVPASRRWIVIFPRATRRWVKRLLAQTGSE